jgi:hypothetical protein
MAFVQFLCTLFPAVLSVFITPRDASSLRALHEATNGSFWVNSRGWGALNSTPCHEVYGVECNGSGFVTGLELTGNGLRGSIPDVLGTCSALERLYLGQNYLTGTLPSLGGCALTGLHLHSNNLRGSVPADLFGNNCQLQGLWLYSNRFTGQLPDLGRCLALSNVTVSANAFNGFPSISYFQATLARALHLV